MSNKPSDLELYKIITGEARDKFWKLSPLMSGWITREYVRRGGSFEPKEKTRKTFDFIFDLPNYTIEEYERVLHAPKIHPLIAGYIARKPEEFKSKIQDIFNFLSINGKYNIIGTASNKEVEYFGDVDLMTIEKVNLDEITKVFKSKFVEADKSNDIYILDFKCGKVGDEPVRWNSKTIKSGTQKVFGKPITFKECLLQKSTIKLDLIVLIDGVFVEFSNNYYLSIKYRDRVYTNYDMEDLNPEKIQMSIEVDARDQYARGNYFKFLRRVYSILRIRDTSIPVQELLVDFFNSSVGILNKCRNDLEVITRLIDEHPFRKPTIETICNNIQLIKRTLNGIHDIFLIKSVESWLDEVCVNPSLENISKKLKVVIEYLQKKINLETERFILKNKNLLIV